jgi:hypothetical protein
VGVRGVNSACAARRFACETFAQEPIHHQLGLNLKLGWCGVRDCAGPPSLPARNPAQNFGRDWWVVDVAVNRGAIRQDLFPKQVDYSEGPDQRCYRPGVLTIGSKDIVLEYTVPKAPRVGACDLCDPRRCSLERLDQRTSRRTALCDQRCTRIAAQPRGRQGCRSILSGKFGFHSSVFPSPGASGRPQSICNLICSGHLLVTRRVRLHARIAGGNIRLSTIAARLRAM